MVQRPINERVLERISPTLRSKVETEGLSACSPTELLELVKTGCISISPATLDSLEEEAARERRADRRRLDKELEGITLDAVTMTKLSYEDPELHKDLERFTTAGGAIKTEELHSELLERAVKAGYVTISPEAQESLFREAAAEKADTISGLLETMEGAHAAESVSYHLKETAK